jgi:hypothetical protein
MNANVHQEDIDCIERGVRLPLCQSKNQIKCLRYYPVLCPRESRAPINVVEWGFVIQIHTKTLSPNSTSFWLTLTISVETSSWWFWIGKWRCCAAGVSVRVQNHENPRLVSTQYLRARLYCSPNSGAIASLEKMVDFLYALQETRIESFGNSNSFLRVPWSLLRTWMYTRSNSRRTTISLRARPFRAICDTRRTL